MIVDEVNDRTLPNEELMDDPKIVDTVRFVILPIAELIEAADTDEAFRKIEDNEAVVTVDM